MSRIDSLKEYFLNIPEVKRIHELEPYIDSNENIKNKLKELKAIQKKMVNSKEYNQINQYNAQKKEYELKKEELLDIPFVEEYLELISIVDEMLVDVASSIESKIDINE